jgi:hypothetical protein
MATIQVDRSLYPFIFVGCWNNPYNTLDEGAGGAAYKPVFDAINADAAPTLIL